MSSLKEKLPVSLVIPCGANALALAPVLAAIESGSCWPAQVLVVDAAQQLHGCVPSAEPFAALVHVLKAPAPLFPGAARNLGCQAASMNWLAFLDLNTLPPHHWLEEVFASAQQQPGVELVLGTTRYRGKSWQQQLFINATYGERPLHTVPGSLVHRSVFSRVGGFMPGIRAGEDTDWLVRVKQFAIPQIPGPQPPLSYNAVPESLADLAGKWFRNYRSCAPVVFHLETQKTIYVVVANLLIIFTVYNWNGLVAGWQESNFYYIHNITKYSFCSLFLIYLVIRGLVMPLSRGSASKTVLPLRWILIGLVCAVLDTIKLLAFLQPPWRDLHGVKKVSYPLRDSTKT